MLKRNFAFIFLLLGIVFLAVGISTNNNVFTWTAVVFVLLSTILGARRSGPGRR